MKDDLKKFFSLIKDFKKHIETLFSNLVGGKISVTKSMLPALGEKSNQIKNSFGNVKLILDADCRDKIGSSLKRLDSSLYVLKTRVNQALSDVDDTEFKKDKKTYMDLFIAEFSELVDQVNNLLEDILKFELNSSDSSGMFIVPESIVKTKRYLNDCELYRSQADISKIEVKILTYPYHKKLHEQISKGKWNGFRHARLSKNLRIMYHWFPDKRLLVFERIITKNEFDKG